MRTRWQIGLGGVILVGSGIAWAQDYFRPRALDAQKRLLDETVAAYEKYLELTRNRPHRSEREAHA